MLHTTFPGCLFTGVSELPDVRFIGDASTVTEAEGNLTVCAVSGQLAAEIVPVNVTISTVSDTARGKCYMGKHVSQCPMHMHELIFQMC